MIEDIINANNELNKSVNILKSKMRDYIIEQTDYGKQRMVLTDFVVSENYGGIIDILPVDYGQDITLNTESGIISLNELEIDTTKQLAMTLVAKRYELK